MIEYKKTFILLLLCLFSFTIQGNANWTMGDNETIIHSYESNLTEEQRDKYYYWIGLRNSFYFSGKSNQLEKLVKYFTPEEDNYYKELYKFSSPGIVCGGVLLVIILVFLIKRCLLHGCKGPKIIEPSYVSFTYAILIIGAVIGLGFMIVSLVFAVESK